MKIPGHQQGQADDAQIRAFGFGVSPLGQFALVVRRKEGVEIGRIVKERSQIHVQTFHHPPGDLFFDPGKGGFVQVVHVVPEALTP